VSEFELRFNDPNGKTTWWAEGGKEIHRCQSEEKWGSKGKKRNELCNCQNFLLRNVLCGPVGGGAENIKL
jgi:hypothetical protein